jgi:hypothetical protein
MVAGETFREGRPRRRIIGDHARAPERGVPSRPDYCEPPLVAHFYPATTKECLRKMVVGVREWDADLGGFTTRVTAEVCLVWTVRVETRWYCGPPALTVAT